MALEDDNICYFKGGDLEELLRIVSSPPLGTLVVDLCERTIQRSPTSSTFGPIADFIISRHGLVLRNGTLHLGDRRLSVLQVPVHVSRTSSRRSSLDSGYSFASSKRSVDISSTAVTLGLLSVDHNARQLPNEALFNVEGSTTRPRNNHRNRRLSSISDSSSYKSKCIKFQNVKICGDSNLLNADRGLLVVKGGHLFMDNCQVCFSASEPAQHNLSVGAQDSTSQTPSAAAAAVEVRQGGVLNMSACQISFQEGSGLRVSGLGSVASLCMCTLESSLGPSIEALDGANLRIADSMLKGSLQGPGLHAQGSGTRVSAKACRVMGCKGQGVLVRKAARCELLACSVLGGCGTGVEIQGTKSRLTMYDTVIRGCLEGGLSIKDGAWAHVEGADIELNQGGPCVHVIGCGSTVSLSSCILVTSAHSGLHIEEGGYAEIKDSTIDCHNHTQEMSTQAVRRGILETEMSCASHPPITVTGVRSMLLLGEEVEVCCGDHVQERLMVCDGGQVQGQLLDVPVSSSSQECDPPTVVDKKASDLKSS
ncbi:hypothetical protein CEUSTIGMA_g4652.t1 [Chlamydomonas eustigma]|uniref:Right handed beta helix domain-containing protein n=1 Tax=Chlamydomonas eustigma TaxID=1157962 RepID=A0A250X2C8_9CHLO|nr:hypothetical protein CEUSTIGMA_g4652.t1 [Chlamydomonas eustigma]|eukprot:GAX77206.1 hypothetical protein CEUSTIGMA_g4652.t1 [Chlamydomonas eustigma]